MHSGSCSDFLIYQFVFPLLPGSLKKKKKVKLSIEFRKNQDIGWKKVTKKLTWKNYSKNTAFKVFLLF